MRLFDKHSKENEEKAKSALTSVAARLIGKYIVCQELLNSALSGGASFGSKDKQGACLCCIVDKLTSKMSKYENQLGQVIKNHKTLFNEELDVEEITVKAFNDLYPTTSGKSSSKDKKKMNVISDIEIPEDAPQDVKDMLTAITKAITKVKGSKNFDVNVIDMSNTGLNPKDFPSFEDYFKAVKAKVRELKGEKGTKDATIHTVKDDASSKEAAPASNGSEKPSTDGKSSDDKSKLN